MFIGKENFNPKISRREIHVSFIQFLGTDEQTKTLNHIVALLLKKKKILPFVA